MPLKKLAQLIVPSNLDYLAEVDSFIEKQIKNTNFRRNELDDIAIAVSEAANNAMLHGNKLNAEKPVTIKLYQGQKYMRIVVEDRGCGFSPELIPDPRNDENLLKVSGRGILIMRHLMDKISFQRTKRGMKVIMDKNFVRG